VPGPLAASYWGRVSATTAWAGGLHSRPRGNGPRHCPAAWDQPSLALSCGEAPGAVKWPISHRFPQRSCKPSVTCLVTRALALQVAKSHASCARLTSPIQNQASTKRYRLFEALRLRQEHDRCANNVLAFVRLAMEPVRYVGASDLFEQRRHDLNRCLAFSGFQLDSGGELSRVERARTLSEADERASRLRGALLARRVHPDVLAFCHSELL